MEELLTKRQELEALIEIEWLNYRQAIDKDQPFEETKIIYLRIKELKTQVDEVTVEIHQWGRMGE